MRLVRNRKSAFTLVEIMIVVAIIGLLAAIAIPSFVRARKSAQANACINNLRIIDAAKQQWAIENNKSPNDLPNQNDIAPYIGRNQNIANVICPSGGTSFDDSYNINSVAEPPTCKIGASFADYPHVLKN